MAADLVARADVPFRAIPAGGVHGVGLRRQLRNAVRLARGLRAAWRALGEERPAALLTTGGYVSVPVALAAWLRRVPVLVFLPDIEPALSVKIVARVARRVGVTVEASQRYFRPGKAVVTGYPLRPAVTRWTRAKARRAFELEDEPVLLVFGGSRGARSINRAVLANLEALLDRVTVIHISGTLDWETVAQARDALPPSLRARYQAYPYLHERMGAALAAADLVVSRAGASVLGEFPHFGVPAVLVPYPHAWRYQKVNAAWLAERGAALVVEDAALSETLLPTVRTLFADTERRAAMAAASRALRHPDAAETLAAQLFSLQKESG